MDETATPRPGPVAAAWHATAIRSPWLLLGLAVAVIWLGIAFQLRAVYDQAGRTAERDTANLARSVEQHIVRTIGSVDQALHFVQEAWFQDPDAFDLARWARAWEAGGGPTVQLALIGADGVMRASALGAQVSTAPVDLSDREHFRVHATAAADFLFISRPVLGRVSKLWTVQFTRSLRDSDGRFAGVIVISLDPALLSAPYASLELGQGSLMLVGDDGIVRARAPALARAIGETVSEPTRAALAAAPQGHLRHVSEFDGLERIEAFRRGQGYPLTVVVGMDVGSVFADFRHQRARAVAAGLLLTGAVLAVGLVLVRQAVQRGRAEQALRGMDQGVIMSGPDGRVQLANQRAADLLELPPGLAAQGEPILQVLRRAGRVVHGPGWRERPRVFRLLRADGRSVDTKVQRSWEGGLLLTCTEVTEQQAAIAAQDAARKAAEEASRAKSEFLANMSHEIRTPMNGVIGMIQVLRHSGLDEQQRGMCGIIMRSAHALLTVLNDILDYSKLEAGKLLLEPRPARIDVLARDVTELMRHAAEAKGIGLWFQNWAEVPPVMLDPTRLRQVLSNLISNAIKFSDKGEIAVTVEGGPDPAAPEERIFVRLTVEDQGIGMSEEDVARLFVRFTQVDSSSTRRFGGTGLGLAISRDLVRIMGGTIGVTSRLGLGSEFVVELSFPVSLTEPASEHERAEEEEAGPDGPALRLRILVAEDDEVNRVVIRSLLQPGEHDLTFAENGAEAVHAAQRARFDLILMDVMMPELDGPSATRWIRDTPGPCQRTPIIALTANAMSGDRERYIAAGMDAYVSKPVTRRELYSTIERTLGARAFPRGAASVDSPVLPPSPEPEADAQDAFAAALSGLK